MMLTRDMANNHEMSYCFKQKLLETMKKFDAFCEKFNIEYVAAYGTIIGAVRHKGLIPWDDDIDVFMDYDNYNKFISLKNKALSFGCTIFDRRDKGYYLPMAKFADNLSTIWEHKGLPFIFGVYIDIFPLGFVVDIEESKKMHEEYLYHSKMITKGCQRFSFSPSYIKYFIKSPFETIKCFKERKKIERHQLELDKLDSTISKIVSGDYRLYYRSMDNFERSLFKSEWFKSSIRVPFEDFEIPIPIGFDEYLSTCYGDYMTPPPIEKQVSHHSHYYLNLKERLSLDEVKERIKRCETLVY